MGRKGILVLIVLIAFMVPSISASPVTYTLTSTTGDISLTAGVKADEDNFGIQKSEKRGCGRHLQRGFTWALA